MCTGSGIIAVTISRIKKNSIVFASDISDKALEVAKENNELQKTNVEFIQSNLFENINEKDFDIIISNPPYINKQDMESLEEQVKKEPSLALYGGEDGLEFYREISKKSKKYLKQNGHILFEIGYDQSEKVEEILKENNYKDIQKVKDLNGIDRVIIGKRE